MERLKELLSRSYLHYQQPRTQTNALTTILDEAARVINGQPEHIRKSLPEFFDTNQHLLPTGLPLLVYAPKLSDTMLQLVEQHLLLIKNKQLSVFELAFCQILVHHCPTTDPVLLQLIDDNIVRAKIVPYLVNNLNQRSKLATHFIHSFTTYSGQKEYTQYRSQHQHKDVVARLTTYSIMAALLANYLLHYNTDHVLLQQLLTSDTLDIQHMVITYCDNAELIKYLLRFELTTTVEIEDYTHLKAHGFTARK